MIRIYYVLIGGEILRIPTWWFWKETIRQSWMIFCQGEKGRSKVDVQKWTVKS